MAKDTVKHVHGPACATEHPPAKETEERSDDGSDASDDEDVIQHFWGTTVKPESDYTLSLERSGAQGGARSALLDVEVFPFDEYATFRVEGTASVALSGSIAIFGGELMVDDEDEDGEEGDEEDEEEESDGALDDEFEGEEDDEEEEEEEEEEEAAPAPAPAPVSAVEKMKQAKRAREEAPAPAPKKEEAKHKASAPAAPAAAAEAPVAKKAKTDAAAVPAAAKPTGPSGASEIAAASSALRKLENGMVQFKDDVVGMGPAPVKGKNVTVSYVGKLSNGKVFDSSAKFTFRLGVGNVIKGWDVGVAGMKVGGKRTLVIHPSYAYGKAGSAPVIPPNATLIFTVELIKV